MLVFGYTIFEARLIVGGPKLTILSPRNHSTVSEPMIDIKGTAKNLYNLQVNGRPIFITPDGSFNDKLLLLDGYNTIEVKVTDKFGQENKQILEVMLVK